MGTIEQSVRKQDVLSEFSGAGEEHEAQMKPTTHRCVRRYRPDLVAYNSLLDAFGKARMLGDMDRVYHKLRHAGLRPDAYTYTILITNYRRQQRFDEAVRGRQGTLSACLRGLQWR